MDFSISDHVEDSSQFGSVRALARAVEGSANDEFAVFGNKSSPPASGEYWRFAVDGGPVGIPVDIGVTILNGGDSPLGDVSHDVIFILVGSFGPVSEEDVLVRDVVTVFINSGILVANATVEHARGFGDSFDPNRTIGVLGSSLVDGFGHFGQTWVSCVVIMMAMPHDMPGSGSGSFA